jgi:sortase A
MLTINRKRKPTRSIIISGIALCMLGSGLYMLLLVSTPVIMPYIAATSIDPASLSSPKLHDDRVIIPKIGVNIPYGEGEASLDNGAWWRYPERGNPEKGGNFILAAHRFEIRPTPQATWEKSPFYRVDQLGTGDEIIVDYNGKRYGYKVDHTIEVKPTQIEVEAPSDEPKLTLYSCDLGGAKSGRIVIVAKPLGEVTLKNTSVTAS